MTNPLLQGLAQRMLFEADLHHKWTDGQDSRCGPCGEWEISVSDAGLICQKRIEELMLKFAQEAHKRGILNVG